MGEALVDIREGLVLQVYQNTKDQHHLHRTIIEQDLTSLAIYPMVALH